MSTKKITGQKKDEERENDMKTKKADSSPFVKHAGKMGSINELDQIQGVSDTDVKRKFVEVANFSSGAKTARKARSSRRLDGESSKRDLKQKFEIFANFSAVGKDFSKTASTDQMADHGSERDVNQTFTKAVGSRALALETPPAEPKRSRRLGAKYTGNSLPRKKTSDEPKKMDNAIIAWINYNEIIAWLNYYPRTERRKQKLQNDKARPSPDTAKSDALVKKQKLQNDKARTSPDTAKSDALVCYERRGGWK